MMLISFIAGTMFGGTLGFLVTVLLQVAGDR